VAPWLSGFAALRRGFTVGQCGRRDPQVRLIIQRSLKLSTFLSGRIEQHRALSAQSTSDPSAPLNIYPSKLTIRPVRGRMGRPGQTRASQPSRDFSRSVRRGDVCFRFSDKDCNAEGICLSDLSIEVVSSRIPDRVLRPLIFTPERSR
jgi:hypothetical protein